MLGSALVEIPKEQVFQTCEANIMNCSDKSWIMFSVNKTELQGGCSRCELDIFTEIPVKRSLNTHTHTRARISICLLSLPKLREKCVVIQCHGLQQYFDKMQLGSDDRLMTRNSDKCKVMKKRQEVNTSKSDNLIGGNKLQDSRCEPRLKLKSLPENPARRTMRETNYSLISVKIAVMYTWSVRCLEKMIHTVYTAPAGTYINSLVS